jgi:predicted transcriptional regulator
VEVGYPASLGARAGPYHALNAIATGEAEKPQGKTVPALSIKESVTDAYIVCLEDGKRLKMLKRVDFH